MKKMFIIPAVLVMAGITSGCFAHYDCIKNKPYYHHPEGGYVQGAQKGGFTGSTAGQYVTVLEARKMPDNNYVRLKGNIVSKTGNERYLFKDGTGTIEIEIDDDNWRGTQAGPDDVVIIEGEIDKDWNSTSIDVDTVILAK